MRNRRNWRGRIGLTLLATVLVLGAAHAGWAGPAAPAHGAPARTAGQGLSSVTLLTGDRVVVSTNGTTVVPGKGRAQVTFIRYRSGGDHYVVPRDAVRLIETGRLDKRLFDVDELIRDGYDDGHRSTLPLLVSYRTGVARPGIAGTRTARTLPVIHGAALVADKRPATWAALSGGSGIDRVWLDGLRRVVDDVSTPQIGAPVAWQAGYTGSGVTVAVLDTGVDASHPDLAGKVVAEQNFTEDLNPADTVGHGTHVASIIAGTGAASGGKYVGVAPDAKLYDGKVCADEGCSESAILAGMQWAAADVHAKVANLSLGGGDSPDIDPLEQAVNDLTARYGTLFVIAAGNAGPGDGTVSSPGSADAALTVGAVDKSDRLAPFSSRGPRVGDDAMKPDLTAPGVDIVAANATGTQLGDPVGDQYVSLSGTSMATPHVTGSVALLVQEHPQWTPERYKDTLMAAARPDPAQTGYQQGAGRVDVGRAVGQTLTSDPASVSLGRQSWPHGDDPVLTRTVTYRNSGPTDAALTVSAHIIGPDGAAPPAGLVALSTDTLTVPAGGQAQLTVTVDTRVASADGLWSGDLLATTAGGARVSTPIGVNKEVESYNLTVRELDRTGAPATDALSLLINTADGTGTELADPSGTVTVRVPKGSYDLAAYLFTDAADPAQSSVTLLDRPVLNLTADTTVTLDARTGRPVDVTVPDPSAQPGFVEAGYQRTTPAYPYGVSVLTPSFAGVYIGQQGAAAPAGQSYGEIAGMWAHPDATGNFGNSPDAYVVTEYPPGGLPNGFTKHYRAADLATVHDDYRTTEAGDGAAIDRMARSPLGGGDGFGVLVSLPREFTWHLNAGPQWIGDLMAGPPDQDGFPGMTTQLTSSPARYRAGHTYRDTWNAGPFGPAFPAPNSPEQFITRRGDTLIVALPLFSDAAGHMGGSAVDAVTVTLSRDGVQIGQSADGTFELPPATAAYTLDVTVTRTGFGGLSSAVHCTWTFHSGHSTGDGYTKVPVSAVRFTPRLDGNNAAPAGRPFTVPVSVQSQTGDAKVRRLGVRVSYDDGKTWRPAVLLPARDGWVALVDHPSGPGWVSLQASATDAAGNTVEQTIIHAYQLK